MKAKLTNDNTFSRNIYILLIQYKWQLFLVLLTMLVFTFTSFCGPIIRQYLIDKGILEGNWNIIIWCLFIFVIIWAAQSIVDFVQFKICFKLEQNLQFRLFYDGFNMIMKMENIHYERTGIYSAIENLKTDVSIISLIVDRNIILSVCQLFEIIGGIFGLFLINWKLALITLIIIPIKLLTIKIFTSIQKKVFLNILESLEQWNNWMGDMIQNIEVIKLWNLYPKVRKQLIKNKRSVINANYKAEVVDKIQNISNTLLDTLLNLFSYAFGAMLIINGELTLGGLFAYFTYAASIVSPISLVAFIKKEFTKIAPSLKRYLLRRSLPWSLR